MDTTIANAQQKVKQVSAQILCDKMQAANERYLAAQTASRKALAALKQAIKDRDSAYRDYATRAGKKAGGGAQGERLEAALKAIPIVRDMCGSLAGMVSALEPPKYSHESGQAIADADADTISGMFATVGLLKGLQLAVGKELSKWHVKLEELVAVSEKIGDA